MARWVKESGVAKAAAEVTAAAWIQSLAQELPYALGEVIEKKKKKEKILRNKLNQGGEKLADRKLQNTAERN